MKPKIRNGERNERQKYYGSCAVFVILKGDDVKSPVLVGS